MDGPLSLQTNTVHVKSNNCRTHENIYCSYYFLEKRIMRKIIVKACLVREKKIFEYHVGCLPDVRRGWSLFFVVENTLLLPPDLTFHFSCFWIVYLILQFRFVSLCWVEHSRQFIRVYLCTRKLSPYKSMPQIANRQVMASIFPSSKVE
jgi:hypothetical protein